MAGNVNKVILVGAEHGVIDSKLRAALPSGRVPVS